MDTGGLAKTVEPGVTKLSEKRVRPIVTPPITISKKSCAVRVVALTFVVDKVAVHTPPRSANVMALS